jgi:hypothetical protein
MVAGRSPSGRRRSAGRDTGVAAPAAPGVGAAGAVFRVVLQAALGSVGPDVTL